jgi:hypothetical protein
MEWIQGVLDFVNSNQFAAAVGALLVLSEALPFSDTIKSNGIFQMMVNGLKSLQKKP